METVAMDGRALVVRVSERGLVHREEVATVDVRKPSCYRDTPKQPTP